MEIEHPLPVEPVLKRLENSGHRACLAGDCVPDWLLGRIPEVWEILSSALPGEIAGLFAGTEMEKISINAQDGAVGLRNRHYSCEIISLSGGSREGERDFMGCLEEELSRRDFTVNAIAYSLKDGFVDPFLGRADLENRIICCVGDPDRYFAGNGQVILRAVRTAALLGFRPDARLLRAAIEHRETLAAVPADYVGGELRQIFSGCGDGLAGLVRQTQEILLTILPELIPMVGFQQNSRYHVHDVWQHTLAALEAAGRDEIVRFTVLFHDIGKPYCYTEDGDGTGHFYGHGAVSANITDQVLGRLGFDGEIRAKIAELVKYHDVDFKESHRSMRRWLSRLGPEQMRRLLEVRRCDIWGQNPQLIRERTEEISRFTSILEEVEAEETHFRVRDLAVSGADLIKIGYTPGRGLGEALRGLAAMVEDGRLHNERVSLLEEASRQLVVDTNICS